MTSRTTAAIALKTRALPVVSAVAARDFALVSLVLVLVLIITGGAG
jgi:hypothetical protein